MSRKNESLLILGCIFMFTVFMVVYSWIMDLVLRALGT